VQRQSLRTLVNLDSATTFKPFPSSGSVGVTVEMLLQFCNTRAVHTIRMAHMAHDTRKERRRRRRRDGKNSVIGGDVQRERQD